MICKECGQELPAGSRFCPFCGAGVAAAGSARAGGGRGAAGGWNTQPQPAAPGAKPIPGARPVQPQPGPAASPEPTSARPAAGAASQTPPAPRPRRRIPRPALVALAVLAVAGTGAAGAAAAWYAGAFDSPAEQAASDEESEAPQKTDAGENPESPQKTPVQKTYENYRDAYLGKIEEYQEKYGEAHEVSMPSGDGTGMVYLAGMNYAEVVDFGDGVPRLVVGYCEDFGSPDFTSWEDLAQHFAIEVWEYDASAKAAKRVWAGTANGSGTGLSMILFRLDMYDGSERFFIQQYGPYMSAYAAWNDLTYYGMTQSGAFGAVDNDTDIGTGTSSPLRVEKWGTLGTSSGASAPAGETLADTEQEIESTIASLR